MGKGRKPCCDKAGVKKGPWSQAEDFKLMSFIQKHGHNNWRALPKLAGLARCGKSCRLRWVNYLRPDLKRGNFTIQEEETIIKLHEKLGNKWSKIASQFPGRTDNEIKNVWNTHLKKRLKCARSNDNNSTTSSCNELSTNTSTLNNKALDGSNESHCFEQAIMHPGTTNNDAIEYSSSSSNSFSDHLMMDDLIINPSKIDDGVEHKDETSICMNKISNEKSQDEVIEIPYEPNLDLWDLLHGESDEIQFKDVDTPISEIYNNSNNIYNNSNNNSFQESGESWWWLVYLENELGLEHQNESTPLLQSTNVSTFNP